MRVRALSAFLLTLSFLTFTGCWDYNDYEELTLVSAVGFDMDESTKEITITVEYYIPKSGGSTKDEKKGTQSPQNAGVVKASGRTIADSLSAIQQASGKRLYYAYLDVFVVGENAAKSIMKQIIQYSDRTPNIRTTAYVAVTKGKAEDVLSTIDPNLSVPAGRNIHNLIDQAADAGSAFPVHIEDFAEKLVISGVEPVAPLVAVKSTKEPNTGSSTTMKGDGPLVITEQKSGFQIIEGIAAFKGDKLVGFLDKEESIGLGWITGKKITPYENVNPSSTKDIKNTLLFDVIKSKSRIGVEFINERPVITIKTSIEADLRKEADNLEYESLTPAAVSMMGKELSNKIRSEIKAAIEKGQKDLKTDIFGFGFASYRKSPKLWHSQYEKRWEDLFPDLQVSVKVDAKIINTGTNVKKFVIK